MTRFLICIFYRIFILEILSLLKYKLFFYFFLKIHYITNNYIYNFHLINIFFLKFCSKISKDYSHIFINDSQKYNFYTPIKINKIVN